MNYREPTMLGERAKSSYQELVRYYKYINKTTRIEDYLIEVFDNALSELKTNYQLSVCRNSKSGIQLTQQQSKCIDILNKKFEINNWSKDVQLSNKLPLNMFEDLVKDVFKVKGRDAITNRKKEILELIQFKQVREGNNWFIVHKNFIQEVRAEKPLFNITSENKTRVHKIYAEVERGELSEKAAETYLQNSTQKRYFNHLLQGGERV